MISVLLPTDFSENSMNAITYALEFFKHQKTEFFVMHAYQNDVYDHEKLVSREDFDDQTMDLPSSATSGYEFISVNAGKLRNEGVEILLSGTPIKTNDFTWEVNLNFTKNKNKVIALHPDIDTYTISEARWAGASIVAKVGGEYGAIMG